MESAVGRQHTSLGATMKYANPIDNAATLTYGLCNDHPFHNGNKRTALVSMLVHLDRNKLSLSDTSQDELYAMILRVAKHTLGMRAKKRSKRIPNRKPDDEVREIAKWIEKRSFRVVRGERPITYRELRSILKNFDLLLEHPDGNTIEIVRREVQTKGLFRSPKEERIHITTIPYPGDGKNVSLKLIKHVRKVCRLCEEHGVDSMAFYDNFDVIDAFINRYRTILRRLANK